MAETVLEEILEKVVEIIEPKKSTEEDNCSSNDQVNQSENDSPSQATATPVNVVNDEVRTDMNDSQNLPEADQYESDVNDDLIVDENNNELLTTEDEAEDFLRYCLNESDGSDLNTDTEKSNNVDSVKTNEQSVDNQSLATTVTDGIFTPLTSSENVTRDVVYRKDLEATVDDKSDGQSLVIDKSTVTCVKGRETEINEDTLLKTTSIPGDASNLVTSDTALVKSNCDDNNNNKDSCANKVIDNTGLYKYDWNSCYDNRDLCTPDVDSESISPELCCLMQLSPDAIYGKDHAVGSQRLYSRQVSQTARSGSTLNTPDPILYGDTDSNGSDLLSGRFATTEPENPLGWPGIDLNNNNLESDLERGMKRKHEHVDKVVNPSPDIMTTDFVSNLMHQGRPPDISTWRAVTPTDDSNSLNTNCLKVDTGPWNKPTCTVPPFQNSTQIGNGISGVGQNSALQPQEMYTAYPISLFDNQAYLGMNQQAYSQYSINNNLSRPSCQFSASQSRNFTNYGYQCYNNSMQTSASYRLDFSSPVSLAAPGMMNFVSHPLYSSENLTRPQAMYANNMPSMNYNNNYSTGPGYTNNNNCTGYSNVANRPYFNTGQFQSIQQPQTQYSVPFQPQQFSFSNYAAQRIGASATQTFAESQTGIGGVYNVNSQQNTAIARDMNSVPLPQHRVENNNRELSESVSNYERKSNNLDCKTVENDNSKAVENDQDNIIGCDECDLLADPVDKSEENEENTNRIDTVKNSETSNKGCEPISDDSADEKDESEFDKEIQSYEADSTTTCIDLTKDQDDTQGNEVAESDAGSPTPAHAYPQVQNKYFTEIYMQKCRSSSPITAFCTALDLSKKAEKKEAQKIQRPVVPQKIRPYGEPALAMSAVLNNMQGPTLAYSGAMLVPYMNSIFAAMAHMNKTQTTLNRHVGMSTGLYGNVNRGNSVGSSMDESPLTHSNSGNLVLNQHAMMYSNLISTGNSGSVSQNAGYSQSVNNLNTQNNNLQSVRSATNNIPTGNSTGALPTMNINGIPLPLYGAPSQYPIRPLVPVMNQIPMAQNLTNPYLYRFNIGIPIQTQTNVNSSVNTLPAMDNNNSLMGSLGDDVSNSRGTACVIAPKPTPQSVKTILEATQRKRKLSESGSGVEKAQHSQAKQAFNACDNLPLPGIAAVNGLSLTIQGSNFSATSNTQSKGLTSYQPIPDGKIYRVPSRKKKTFKAKHFPLSFLRIGSFEYSSGPHYNDKVARVKLIFSKRVMVYEFQLENPDGTCGTCKDMAEIEISFSNIVAIWLYDKDMRVEVKAAPRCCLGKKGLEKSMKNRSFNAAVYDRKLNMDVTDGQLSSSPYHYVQFRNCCADRVRSELRDFDSRFEMMLRIPLIEDPAKSLKQGTKQLTSQLLDPSICLPDEDTNNNYGPVYQPELNKEVTVVTKCSCTNGCSTASCKCCVRGTTCSEGVCDCVNCRNPLNILHQLGLPADQARTDPCLMENVYQIRRLDCYVKTQLVLECCKIPVLLFSCIPGEVRCPNCGARYKYSWCTARLLNENTTPRNHCVKCGKCTDYRNVHCYKCKVCYFAGEDHSGKCPRCSQVGQASLGNDSSTDSDS